jgi:hypothetical protein
MVKSPYLPEYSDDEFLRHLAQNDYMIDQYFTRAGVRLLEIADKIESQNRSIPPDIAQDLVITTNPPKYVKGGYLKQDGTYDFEGVAKAWEGYDPHKPQQGN